MVVKSEILMDKVSVVHLVAPRVPKTEWSLAESSVVGLDSATVETMAAR